MRAEPLERKGVTVTDRLTAIATMVKDLIILFAVRSHGLVNINVSAIGI